MNKVREMRKQRGLKQKDVAQAAQISQPFLHDVEKGNRGATDFTWQRIADALGCKVSDIKDCK